MEGKTDEMSWEFGYVSRLGDGDGDEGGFTSRV